MYIDTRGTGRKPPNKGKSVVVAAMLGAMVGAAVCGGAAAFLCGSENVINGNAFALIFIALLAIFGLGLGALLGGGVGYVID